MIFFHRTQVSTEYTVLTPIGVWVQFKINAPTHVVAVAIVQDIHVHVVLVAIHSLLVRPKLYFKLHM